MQPQDGSLQSRSRDHLFVGILALLTIISYVDRGSLSVFAPLVQHDLTLSDSEMGLLFGLGFIGPLAIISLFVGSLVDRYNRVAIIGLGLLTWSVATALCGLADSFAQLLIARGGVGAGEAVLAPAAYSLIASRFPAERRGRAVGVIAAAVSIGQGMGLLGGGALLSIIGERHVDIALMGLRSNWQAAFMILGVAGLAAALLLPLLGPDRGGSARSASPSGSLWHAIRDRKLIFSAIFVCCGINVMVGTGIVVWAPTLMTRRFGLEAGSPGYILGMVLMLGGLLGAPIAASLSDRWIRARARGGRIRAHPLLFVAMLVAATTMALGSAPAIVYSGFLLLIFVLAALNALSYAAVQDISPARFRGRMLAALQLTTLVSGYAGGPSLIAFFTDRVLQDPMRIDAAILLMAVPLTLLGAVLAWCARNAYFDRESGAL